MTPVVSSWLTSPRNSKGNTGSGGRAPNERGVGKIRNLQPISRRLRNGVRYDQGYCDGLIGSRIGYALLIGTKVDDLG